MQNRSLIKNTWRGVQNKIRSIFHNPYREVGLSWSKLKYYKHLPSGKLRKHRLAGKYIYFYSPAELLHGFKEIFIDKIYEQSLPSQPTIIDCGANIGMSVIYMKEQYPAATIIAFEPDEKNFELLTKNISSFGYSDVIARQEAVWIEDTVLNFSNNASMSSKIDHTATTNIKKVNAIRLKDLLTKQVDFLKMDIEGAEFEVLSDLDGGLTHVTNMFIEYHGMFGQQAELTKLFSIISGNGFLYYIKEAAVVYSSPLKRDIKAGDAYDIQLNIFCFRS
ncbi:MAG: FkbM family methyltransferase [Chitinophagaceae bacterium]